MLLTASGFHVGRASMPRMVGTGAYRHASSASPASIARSGAINSSCTSVSA